MLPVRKEAGLERVHSIHVASEKRGWVGEGS